MTIASQQIGWDQNAKLLWQISKQLEQLISVTYNNSLPNPLLNILNQNLAAQTANLWITGDAKAGTFNGLTVTNNGTNVLNIAAGQSLIVPVGGTLGTAAYTASTAYEVPLTFSGGLTRTINAISISNLTLTTALTNNGGIGTLTWPIGGATLTIPTGGGTAEIISNKVTSISVASTDIQYPSAKLLYDQLAGKGVGDMLLGTIQSVTAEKKFTKDKLSMLGTSTGKTTFSTANIGVTDYTQTFPARDGTIANLDNVLFIGTTSIALNRTSAALVLTGITSIDGTAAKATNLVGGVLGSIPYQSGVDTTSMLSPNITTTRKVLTQTGTGAIGAAPVWEEIDIILAQGLNWNSSTDVYTRLGSLSAISVGTSAGNAYLPIQSSMKRCLTSDAGVVNYYIDSTNPINKDGTTVLLTGTTDSTSAGHLMNSTGDFITNGVLVGMYIKNITDTTYAMITAVAAADLTIGLDIMVSGETYEIGTALYDGTDGQVVTEVPKFYYKQGVNTNDHYWYISKYKLTGFTLHPAFWKDGKEVDYRYYSSFEGSMYDDSAGAMCSAANISGNIYAAGDKLCSVANQWAKTNETRTSYRAMAQSRSAAYRDHDYYLLSAIQLLYLIEYASFNSQTMIGGGRTNLTGGTWVADSYIGKTGFSVKDGNNTTSVMSGTLYSLNGTGYMTDYMTYRGIENWYGNVWKFIDGITWDSTLNDTTSPIPVYVTNNSAYFKDSGSANMQLLCNATNIGGTNAGYSKNIENVTGFIPSAIGGSSTTYLTDYYYQYSSNGNNWRAPLFGGSSINGSIAGAFNLYFELEAASRSESLGSRLCL